MQKIKRVMEEKSPNLTKNKTRGEGEWLKWMPGACRMRYEMSGRGSGFKEEKAEKGKEGKLYENWIVYSFNLLEIPRFEYDHLFFSPLCTPKKTKSLAKCQYGLMYRRRSSPCIPKAVIKIKSMSFSNFWLMMISPFFLAAQPVGR